MYICCPFTWPKIHICKSKFASCLSMCIFTHVQINFYIYEIASHAQKYTRVQIIHICKIYITCLNQRMWTGLKLIHVTLLHMIIIINLTFDLDLWRTDLNINRDHLLIKDYLPNKFEASGPKRSWVISCTRLRDTNIPTDMCNATQYASFFEGGHKYVCFQWRI